MRKNGKIEEEEKRECETEENEMVSVKRRCVGFISPEAFNILVKRKIWRALRAGHQEGGIRRPAGTALLMMGVKVLRTDGRSQHPGRSRKKFSHSGRIGDAGKGQEKAPGLKAAERV